MAESVGFVADPDGYQVELAQRHPWTDGDDTTFAWLGQYCINVTDLDRSDQFYEALGLSCTSRTDIPDTLRPSSRTRTVSGKVQLAQKANDERPSTWAPPCGSST